MKKGTLKQNGVHLQPHEFATVHTLLELGYDIELIPPSRIKGLRMPDIMMNGVPWEIKSPEGSGKKTVQNTMQNAAHQSGNVIVDLRRCKLDEVKAIKDFQRQFKLSKRVKHLMIITKDGSVLDINQK